MEIVEVFQGAVGAEGARGYVAVLCPVKAGSFPQHTRT